MRKNINCTSLSFGHNVISFSTTAKNLGFHFTDDMRIDVHVQDISHKAYIDTVPLCYQNWIIVILFYMVAQCICWKDIRRFKTQQQDKFFNVANKITFHLYSCLCTGCPLYSMQAHRIQTLSYLPFFLFRFVSYLHV